MMSDSLTDSCQGKQQQQQKTITNVRSKSGCIVFLSIRLLRFPLWIEEQFWSKRQNSWDSIFLLFLLFPISKKYISLKESSSYNWSKNIWWKVENKVKLDKSKKFWYLLFRNFQLLLPQIIPGMEIGD